MASGATDNVPVSAAEPIELEAILHEAVGSAVLCGGIFAVALWLGNADVRSDAVTVIIGAITTGAIAMASLAVFARRSGSQLVPAGALARATQDTSSPSDATALILAQSGGAALVGFAIGVAVHRPIAAVPEMWSWDNLLEGATPLALTIGVRSLGRRGSALWIGTVVTVATLAGVRFLGLPTVVLGNAFAGGTGITCGAVLAAQIVGMLVGLALPLPAFPGAEVASAADRSS